MSHRASFDAALAGRADTLASRFLDRAGRDPERVAYWLYPLGAINALGTLRWGEWMIRARGAAGSFLAHHIAPGERIAVFAANRELWPIASMAASIAGLIAVGLHPATTPELLREQIRDCRPAVVIVDTLARLKLIRRVQTELHTPFIVLCDDLEALRSSDAESLFEWDTWVRRGTSALEEYETLRTDLARRVESLRPDDIASISYREGTSVGVMYTHASQVADAAALSAALELRFSDRMLVTEPFCNPFDHAMGIAVPIYTGLTVALTESPDESRSAGRQQRVTHVCATSLQYDMVTRELVQPTQQPFALRQTVDEHFGAECHTLVLHAECVPIDSERELDRAGVRLTTVFGVPEHTLIALNTADHWHDDSAGQILPSVEVRIAALDELQVKRSASSCAGYFGKEESFSASVTSDGAWIRTGRRAQWIDGNSLRITGNLSDTVALPDGELAHSEDIERALNAIPFVAHTMCDATPQGGLVALLSLHRDRVESWARQLGIVVPWEALVTHPLVYEELARQVVQVNASRKEAEHVVAFAPTEVEFSQSGGELDAAGHLVRDVILSRYEHVFAELHARAEQSRKRTPARAGGAT